MKVRIDFRNYRALPKTSKFNERDCYQHCTVLKLTVIFAELSLSVVFSNLNEAQWIIVNVTRIALNNWTSMCHICVINKLRNYKLQIVDRSLNIYHLYH